jgi:hypothetical protein
MMPIIGLTGNLLLFFHFSLASENVAGTQDAYFCVTVWPKFLSRLLPNVLICTFLLGIHDSPRLHALLFWFVVTLSNLYILQDFIVGSFETFY